MEFKFRAGDHRPPPPSLPPPRQYASPLPPAVYCFSKQGFTEPCFRRNIMRKPFDLKLEAIHCEIELMNLREEKLLVEVERQRFLKEEARRELMFAEREIAIRGAAQAAGYSFPDRSWGPSFAAAPPPPVPVVQSFHEWHRMEQLKSSDRRGFGAVPLLPPPPAPPLTADDDKQQQRQVQAEKSEVIVLEKPDPELFREKQKAEAPLALDVGDTQPSGAKKNPKDKWSCALCQVTVLNERTFNQHLRGKKHQRKEAALRAQKASNAAPAPKKRKKTSGSENELKVGDSPQCEKTGNKKFKFWCEMCKVAAHASEVMEAHLKGKKHKASLQEVAQSGTGQPL